MVYWGACCSTLEQVALREHLRSMKERKHLAVVYKGSQQCRLL